MNYVICYMFFLMFIIFIITGISYYFNIFQCIINIKINYINKKFYIINKKEYIKFCGIYNLILSIICFVNLFIIIFKSNFIGKGLWMTTIITNILAYMYINKQKKYIYKKSNK